ncbi:MAG: PD-(D/E)XK nuclease domain-containing protein [Saprospiraceae bacterium]|nr:PD-(D/E)XK nuclease domain-containing protein [Saprospiraceae bacterium]MBP6567237.1 PD-(D/E)XK nuclease domain-containing protein [Saprospiraceae bacterium]
MNQEKEDFYQLKDLIEPIKFYYKLLDYIDFEYYNRTGVPFTRTEVLTTIQLAEIYAAKTKSKISHPSIVEAIKTVEIYKERFESKADRKEFPNEICIGNEFLFFLLTSANDLSFQVYQIYLEVDIKDLDNQEKIEQLVREKQALKYSYVHSKYFFNKAQMFLENRINDFKELSSLEKTAYNAELKEIIKSYLKGIKVNVKGKDLLNPLLQKDYNEFLESLKNLLYIPSYFDITKDDKERIFHIYLLGILEGRMIFYNSKSNKESGAGRYDIALIPIDKNNTGVIIEIKKINNSKIEESLDEALNQIKDKSYFIEMKNEGITECVIIAVVFEGMIGKTKHEIISI